MPQDEPLIESLFADALDQLRYVTSLSSDHPDYVSIKALARRTGLVRQTLVDLREGVARHNQPATLNALIDGLLDREFIAYKVVATEMGCGPQEMDTLRHSVGKFRYVRKNSSAEVVTGTLTITHHRGVFRFVHVPDLDLDEKDNSDGHFKHVGYVYQLSFRLVFFGIGPRYGRMMLAANKETKETSVYTGIVLTTDSHNREPLASLFFMAHEKYRKLDEFEAHYLSNFDEEATNANISPGLLQVPL